MQILFSKTVFSRLFLLLLCSALAACVTPVGENKWPSSLPDRKVFVDNWQIQRDAGTNDSSLDNHLVWIRRFYEGSVLYPIGWNQMSDSVLDSLDTQRERQALRPRLRELGLAISIEWAQNNADRKINSSAIAVWGGALRTAIEEKQQFIFVEKIEQDVTSLLNGNLKSSEIVRERYYPPQDYDNF